MNVHRDEFGCFVAQGMTAGGIAYYIESVPSCRIEAVEGDVIALSAMGEALENAVLCRGFGGLEPSAVFGAWFDPNTPSLFRLEGFKPLIVLSHDLYCRGEVAEDEIPSSREAYHPDTPMFEPVPGFCRTSDNPHVQTVTINRRRFSRLTVEGLDAAVAIDQAEQDAERRRAVIEAEDARQRFEVENEARENASAEAALLEEGLRLLEKRRIWQARQVIFDKWLHALPAPLKPDALVLDLWELNPRVAQVRYPGVTRRLDGTYEFNVSRLGMPGEIQYSPPPTFVNTEAQQLWRQTSNWEIAPFGKEGDPRSFLTDGRFVPYEGSKPLGTIIPRAEALAGQVDRWSKASSLVMVGLDFVGNEFTGAADDLFTGEEAIDFLRAKEPRREGISHRYSEDDIEVANEPPSIEDRYADYLNGDALSGAYTDLVWEPQDRRLLDAEAMRRLNENKKWAERRPLYLELLKSMGALFPAEGSNFGSSGIFCQIAIDQDDLHKVRDVLRESCQVTISQYQDEPVLNFRRLHHASRDAMRFIWNCWQRCAQNAHLFRAMAATVTPPQSSFEFVWDGMIPRRMVTLLVGPAKLGKSTIVWDLAACMAAGIPFGKLATKKGMVVILTEDPPDITTERRLAAAEQHADAGANLVILSINSFGRSIEAILEVVEKLPDLVMIVVDTVGALLGDTNPGGPARSFMDRLEEFAEGHNCAVLAIHHTGKDLNAARAKSAKTVFDKLKGSGEFVNVARVTLTLHVESNSKDEETVLNEGIRHITLYRDNIPSRIPRLLGSLGLRLDHQTGLSEAIAPANIGVRGSRPQHPVRTDSQSGPAVEEAVADEDAKMAAPIIRRIEADRRGKLAVTGKKSLFYLKNADELKGWSRARCERAHRTLR